MSARPLLPAWLLVALLAWLWCVDATAQDDDSGDKATARQLFHDAGVAMSARDYAKAADLYARSDALYPAPTAALGQARALVQLGRLLDASERYHALINRPLPDDASDAFRDAVGSAKRERQLVMDRIPSLLVTLEGEADVSLDDKPLPAAALGVKRLVDPGRHVVRARVDGRVVFEKELEVAEGALVELPIRIAADPTEPQRSVEPNDDAPEDHPLPTDETQSSWGAQHTAGALLIGLGAAGLVVWGATGIVYLRDRKTIDEQCDDQKLCTEQGLDAVDRGKTIGLVNTVSLFASLAVGATGLTVLLTAPDGHVALTPWLSPHIAGGALRLRF